MKTSKQTPNSIENANLEIWDRTVTYSNLHDILVKFNQNIKIKLMQTQTFAKTKQKIQSHWLS